MKIIQLLDLVDTKTMTNMNTKNNTSLDLERPKMLINRFISSAQEGSHRQRDTPKSTVNITFIKNPIVNKKKEKSFVRPPVKDSLRERHIKEWAFKKVDLKDLLKSKDFDPKQSLQLKKHEIWFDDDDFLDNKKQIDLSELIDPEADEEFYRQHRNSGMYKNKADAQKNILFKLLDKRLLDISKDRFKLMNHVDYQKKIFIKKQLLKSKSLPGLNCTALETFKPHQFDQLQDLEAALNNSRKKAILTASAIRKKSSIKNLNLSTRSHTLINMKEKSRFNHTEGESQENEQFKFDINSNLILSSIKKAAEVNSTNEPNHLNTSSQIQTNPSSSVNLQSCINLNLSALDPNNNVLHESFLTTKKLSTTFFEESFRQIEPQANNLSDSKRISNRDLIYRSPKRDNTVRNNEESLKSFRTPIVDRRFNNLITFIKPCYLHKDSKDIAKIINENDALRTNNLNSESKEKLRKMRENGGRLADMARKVIESGEYELI